MKTGNAFSLPSMVAILGAFMTFATGAFWGFFWALVAIVFGVIGVLLGMASRERGGALSLFAVVMGLIGVAAAGLKLLFWLIGWG